MNTMKRFEKGGDDYMVQFFLGLTTLAFSYLNGGRGLRIRQTTRTVVLLMLTLPLMAAQSDFYVATTGSDAANGEVGTPVLTLSNAMRLATSVGGKTSQKRIFIRGGSYYNVQCYLDGFDDNGNVAIQSYPGESAVLYGGLLVTNTWTDNGDGTWTAALGTFPPINTNATATTTWQPRALVADGAVVKWAQYPDSTLAGTNKLHFSDLTTTVLTYTNTMEATTNNELCIDNGWNDAQVAVFGIDTANSRLTNSASIAREAADDVKTYTLRNGKEGMLSANTFWWDKTNSTIVFRPAAGVDPNTLDVVVPTTTRIIYLHGMTLGGSLITNVCLSNLTLACTTAALHDGTKKDAGQFYDGAVTMHYTTNCVVDGCTFYGAANHAIEGGGTLYGGYNYGLTVRNCAIHDCGAGGISLRGVGASVTITNNLVYNLRGGVTQTALGIGPVNGGVGATNLILWNTITNLDGPGVFSGLGQNHLVAYNIVDGCVRQLRDMGGIYFQNTSTLLNNRHIVLNNYIADINTTNSLNGGIWDPYVIGVYLDNYTSNSIVASNVLVNCASPVMHYRCGTSNTFKNNFFINYSDIVTVHLGPAVACASGQDVTMQNNVFWSLGLFGSERTVDTAANDWTGNITYSVAGTTGQPTAATKTDPLIWRSARLADLWQLRSLVFGFGASSPAPALGIQPIDLTGIGCTMARPTAQKSVSGKVVFSGTLQ